MTKKPSIVDGRPLIDMTGDQIGAWYVLGPALRGTNNCIRWLCRCSCGTERSVAARDLRSGRTKSCGCLGRLKTTAASTKHGHGSSRDPTYNAWMSMKMRCYNVSSPFYAKYGGRGIIVCDRWLNDFAAFLADMGPRPGPGYSIDRIDNNGNYEPGNCRWATQKQQARNKSNNRLVVVDGVEMTLADAMDLSDVSKHTIRYRLKQGWPIERALEVSDGRRRRGELISKSR